MSTHALKLLVVLTLGCCFGSGPGLLFGQAAAPDSLRPVSQCQDVVYFKNGNVFRGQLLDYQHGKQLTLRTHNGLELVFHDSEIKRLVQDCDRIKVTVRGPRTRREYDFKEKGWFNATRAGLLVGQASWGENVRGMFLQHTVGRQFHRLLGIGVGAGFENFTPDAFDVATYPLFAEARGYFLPKNISPYFALGGGWAFAGRTGDDLADQWNSTRTDRWQGGWMGHARLGYRLGNHLTLDFGLRLQRKTRSWTALWTQGEYGTDRILNKRLELALGMVF